MPTPPKLQIDPFTLILLALILVSLVQLAITYFSRRREPPEPQYVYKKLVVCTSTGEQRFESFEAGDFVGKVVGTCGENGRLIIQAIYAEPIKSEAQRRSQLPRF